VDHPVNRSEDPVCLFGLKLWFGGTKIRVKTLIFNSICNINHGIHVSHIGLMLCYTSWTKLWRDPQLACFPGQQKVVDGGRCERNELSVTFIKQ